MKRPPESSSRLAAIWAIAVGCLGYMGRTPVPRFTLSVAFAYAARTRAASRASGIWVVQTDLKPRRSAILALSTDSSSFLTAGLKTPS